MPPRVKDTFGWIAPSEVYFTHSKIRPKFSCGRAVVDTLQDIRDGKVKIESLPKITVLREGECLFSLNNRRLWILKQCEMEGLLLDGKVYVRVCLTVEYTCEMNHCRRNLWPMYCALPPPAPSLGLSWPELDFAPPWAPNPPSLPHSKDTRLTLIEVPGS